MLVQYDGRGVVGWPIGIDQHPLEEWQVVRLPYRESRTGLTWWEIVVPKRWVQVTRYGNIHRVIREAAIDALRFGAGYYLRRHETAPWEAETIFEEEVRAVVTVTTWRTLWYAYAQAWKGLCNRFGLSPAMAYRLLLEDGARAISKRNFRTYFGGHLIRKQDGTWLLMFKK